MAEYIEKESLIKRCRMIAECEWNTKAAPVSWSDAYESFADEIENFPSVDVVERKRGELEWREEWETHHETRSCDLISCGWYCTECGIELGEYLTKTTGQRIILDDDTNAPKLARCPNCGADMRGADHALQT